MPITSHNPPGVFPPYRAYSHAVEVRGYSRLLVISGLNGYEVDGTTMPESLEAQARNVWAHRSTVVCCRLLDPRWKLEVEAMAAK